MLKLAKLPKKDGVQYSMRVYLLLTAARPLPTLVPKHQIVKEIMPSRSIGFWPPPKAKRKKKGEESGDKDAEDI